jgi:hypothetical protein
VKKSFPVISKWAAPMNHQMGSAGFCGQLGKVKIARAVDDTTAGPKRESGLAETKSRNHVLAILPVLETDVVSRNEVWALSEDRSDQISHIS